MVKLACRAKRYILAEHACQQDGRHIEAKDEPDLLRYNGHYKLMQASGEEERDEHRRGLAQLVVRYRRSVDMP